MKHTNLLSLMLGLSLTASAISGCTQASNSTSSKSPNEANSTIQASEDSSEVKDSASKAPDSSDSNTESTTDASTANYSDNDAASATTDTADFDGNLIIKDGALQPMLHYSEIRDPDYTNEGSDILRFCVYVETDHDTDNDGMNDLVKALVQVPRSAAEGKYKAGVIYDPTPYGAGVVEENSEGAQKIYVEESFNYDDLYKEGKKHQASETISTLDAAAEADPESWNYHVPVTDEYGFSYASDYDYYLVRGFAVVEASGIGTYGSEGFELCGLDLERDSHKCVIEWLTGDRKAFSDKNGTIEIAADWSNGKVAMTGCSYGGTIPFEVATTGVKGLETIIPFAGIASWYDYTNSQGAPLIFDVNYADYLAAYNCGGTYLDNDWTVINDSYGSFLWQISMDQEMTNGDYAPIWEMSDYTKDWKGINCSALIVHGLNDFNVTTRQCDLMYQAFKKAKMPVKLILHQDGHNTLDGIKIGDTLWQELMNKWLSHYLYDVDNGIENMAEVTVQSNIDGTFKTYDSWRDFDYEKMPVDFTSDTTNVSTDGLAMYSTEYLDATTNQYGSDEGKDDFYLSLNSKNAAFYPIDIPEDTTIYGVPEVHVKLKTSRIDADGLMISAVLVDTAENGEPFHAYMLKDRLSSVLPRKTIDSVDMGGDLGKTDVTEYVQSRTNGKCFSYGWTDLCNPGLGPDSSEYSKSTALDSDTWYDYTFYMLPTVYTIPKGHNLTLVLMTWDPYRAFLDEDFQIDSSNPGQVSDYNYSYTVDNKSIEVKIPVK